MELLPGSTRPHVVFEQEKVVYGYIGSQEVGSAVQGCTAHSEIVKGFDIDNLIRLSPVQKARVKNVLQKHVLDVFSIGKRDFGCCDLIEREIPVIDDVPVQQRCRRLPPTQHEEVKAHIKQLLESEVIRESCGSYSST